MNPDTLKLIEEAALAAKAPLPISTEIEHLHLLAMERVERFAAVVTPDVVLALVAAVKQLTQERDEARNLAEYWEDAMFKHE